MGEVTMRRAIAIGAGALLAGSLLAVGVAAHTSHHDSALNLNAVTNGTTNNYFYGAVTSPSAKCVAGRKVRVFRRKPGTDTKYGSDVSIESGSGNGPYTVTAPSKGDLREGDYYSQIKTRDLKPGDRHDHICRGAKSNNLNVGP